MSGSLQNRLQQYEVAPPPAVWDKLARQLDEEFVASDSQLSEKLQDASVNVPTTVWEKINAALTGEMPAEEKSSKVVPLFVRIAAAAAVIGVLVLGGIYFLNSNKPANNIVKTVPQQTTPAETQKQQPQPSDTGNSNPVIANNEAIAPKIETATVRPIPKPRVSIDDTPVNNDYEESFIDYAVKPEQAPLYDLQTVSALQPVSVTAPPLRDKKGNIILDASLISSPHDEYITVTGPNGKQTKISSKFLSCLSYINANLTSNDGDTRAIQCKTQFEEWRKKILAQPAFIPTANNFFDIFELKDLIQEM